MNEIVLSTESPSIQHLCACDKRFAKVYSMVGSITYSPHEDGYAFLIHEIIEQMLSQKASRTIYSRLEALCNGNVCPDTINALTDEEIKSIGTAWRKVNAIRNLTDSIENNVIDLNSFEEMSDEGIIKKITSVHGIGNWTAKMYLIFVLDRQDVLPYEDVAFLQGYKWAYKTDDCSPQAVQKKCHKWRPYSSIAARYMYRALDYGLTKNEFHLFK